MMVMKVVVKVGTSVAKQASPVRPSGRWVNSCHSCVKMWVGQPFCWCYQFNCDLNLEIVNPRLTSESTWSSPSHHRQPWVRDLAKKKQKWMGLIVKGKCTLHRPTDKGIIWHLIPRKCRNSPVGQTRCQGLICPLAKQCCFSRAPFLFGSHLLMLVSTSVLAHPLSTPTQLFPPSR